MNPDASIGPARVLIGTTAGPVEVLRLSKPYGARSGVGVAVAMDARKVLPAGLVIDGKFRIERVIGAGGFGITYAAQDLGLNNTVALKEYYPTEIGVRDQTMSVRPKGAFEADIFERLRVSFVQEARTLAKFRHPSIVRVISVFEAHGTAYMAMEFEEGRSLKSWMRSLGRPPTQDEVDRIFAPLIDALEVLHNARFLHRDIAPDNIIIRKDGTPVLLDFGAARRVVTERSTQMTGLIKQGYSPQEQYTTDGKSQGPWTDIYALGATLYHVVTGSAPPESPVRFIEDTMIPAAQTPGDWRPEFLAGIDRAMAARPQHRPQSLAELRSMLFGDVEPIIRTSRPLTAILANQPDNTATRVAEPAQQSASRHFEPPLQHFYSPPQPPRIQGPSATLRVGAVAIVLSAAAFGVHQYGSHKAAGNKEPPIHVAAEQRAAAEYQRVADEALRNGVKYVTGTGGVQIDHAKARAFFKVAANARKPEAMSWLAQLLLTGQGGEKDVQGAIDWYQAAANFGHVEAMHGLGVLFRSGVDIAKDVPKAIEWFERAAQAGNVLSMVNLGKIYNKDGALPDLDKARQWWERAAAAGQHGAMRELGEIYLFGRGVEKNATTARSWYERSVTAGNHAAKFRLARLLNNGLGGDRNFPRAARLLLQAAQNDIVLAQQQLDGDMVTWTRESRTELKRELQRLGVYNGALDHTWDGEARRAAAAVIRGRT